jgi:hypothetical protein
MAWGWTAVFLTALITTADSPHAAWVSVESTDVLVEPEDAAYSTGRLARSRKVTVRRSGPDGWVTISPPEGSFSFVEESDLEDLGDGRARILVSFASVRPGREGAKMPGPPGVTLRQGALVRLFDRRPLVVRDKSAVSTYVAIHPPPQEVRFLRADTVTDVNEPADSQLTGPRLERLASTPSKPALGATEKEPPHELGPIDPSFFSASPYRAESGVSSDFSQALAKIVSRHQTELRKPIDRWDLAPIEQAYVDLKKTGVESGDRPAIERRLQIVRHQKDAATSASRLSKLVDTSRARDRQIADLQRSAVESTGEIVGDYDVTGLLQSSSKMVDGHRVYSLLGDDGKVVAYVSIPPGLAIQPLLSHRVGIRGEGRFEESLRTRLILVRDVELLKEPTRDPGPSSPFGRRGDR